MLIILAVLSLIAAAPNAAKTVYIKAVVSKDIQVGRMGAHVTNSYYTGYLTVSQRTREPVDGKARLKPLGRMIDVRFKDVEGNKITHIQGGWYVFYMTPKQMKQFKEQRISIFYFDPWPMKWKVCYTWKVYGSENRVGCRIINFGLYGLGYRK